MWQIIVVVVLAAAIVGLLVLRSKQQQQQQQQQQEETSPAPLFFQHACSRPARADDSSARAFPQPEQLLPGC